MAETLWAKIAPLKSSVECTLLFINKLTDKVASKVPPAPNSQSVHGGSRGARAKGVGASQRRINQNKGEEARIEKQRKKEFRCATVWKKSRGDGRGESPKELPAGRLAYYEALPSLRVARAQRDLFMDASTGEIFINVREHAPRWRAPFLSLFFSASASLCRADLSTIPNEDIKILRYEERERFLLRFPWYETFRIIFGYRRSYIEERTRLYLVLSIARIFSGVFDRSLPPFECWNCYFRNAIKRLIFRSSSDK